MPENRNSTILVVDDNTDNLRLLAGILGEQQYQVRLARNGSYALATIHKQAPDLVLLDIMMPEMDGFEVCRRLKADEQTAGIPIIFISALGEIDEKVRAFSYGAVDYITKPFQVEEVLARVKMHLKMMYMQKSLALKNAQLEDALDQIQILQGIIPICARCKKIRDDQGIWNQIEKYIEAHSEAFFSHGLCPECSHAMYKDQEWYRKKHGIK